MNTTIVSIVAGLSGVITAAASVSDKELKHFARQAIHEDPARAADAIAGLRAAGQRGLDALRLFYEGARRLPEGGWSSASRYQEAVDRVARQKDADLSGLFWYTDFDRAKAEAARLGRPILTLRLLGNLDEELSCANSRFFRDILYADAEIAARIKGSFVLHWKSVRPVPRITIDFGDGRVLKRTLTGNSIHYVLDQNGRLVDGLPGLYAPEDFLAWLDQTREFVRSHSLKGDKDWRIAIMTYQRERFESVAIEFDVALGEIGRHHIQRSASANRWRPDPLRMDDVTPEGWRRLALRHSRSTAIDDALAVVSSKTLRQAQKPVALPALLANRISATKAPTEAPILALIAAAERNLRRKASKLESTLAEDTVRNEFILHRRIHEHMKSRYIADADTLNRWVYAELFEMPESDPWLGLRTEDHYTGITNDGVVAVAEGR